MKQHIENALKESKVNPGLIPELTKLLMNPPGGTICREDAEISDSVSLNVCALTLAVNSHVHFAEAVRSIVDYLKTYIHL